MRSAEWPSAFFMWIGGGGLLISSDDICNRSTDKIY